MDAERAEFGYQPTMSLLRESPERSNLAVSLAIDFGVFFIAALVTWLAQYFDRPITAVLAFLTGVIMIAVHSGMTRAVIGAVAASIVYNFFLSEPVYQFGVTTADETIPLVAFNVSALLVGFVVGRLSDYASDAQTARAETQFLLTLSDKLQSAISFEDVELAINRALPMQGLESVKVYLSRGDAYVRPTTGEVEMESFSALIAENTDHPPGSRAKILELLGARGSLGLVKFQLVHTAKGEDVALRLQSITALIAVAIERCLLLDELAEARTAARSEELKDAILASVSHDLRTPITVIETAASALKSSDVSLDGEQRHKMLVSIVEQCHRLDRYTNQLLDVGRIQAGISKLRMGTVDLAEIAQLAIRHVRSGKPEVVFERNFPRERCLVSGNEGMLENALFNLFDNAAKFGGADGPVTVEIAIEGRYARLSVSDRGPGIPAHELDTVFKRFHKSGRNTANGGAGLGLFIARGFIEAANGSIAIESPVDGQHGTRATVRLDLAREPELREAAA